MGGPSSKEGGREGGREGNRDLSRFFWTYSLDLLRRSGVFELEKDNVNDGHCFVVLGCVSVGVFEWFAVWRMNCLGLIVRDDDDDGDGEVKRFFFYFFFRLDVGNATERTK